MAHHDTRVQPASSGVRRERVYRHAELRRALHPESIAIVGASTREGAFGQRLQANLAEYQGRVHLVNARYDAIGNEPCYPSVSELPEVPDLVVLAVPNESVIPVVEECAAAGAGGVVVYASGFAETGQPELVARQQQLSDIAARTGLKIIGPNCLGFGNYALGARITFSMFPKPRPLGQSPVAVASQSGAISQSLVQAMERGVSVSHAFSSGNSCDVDVADLVAYLAEEETCKAIACIFEGMANPGRMIEAAEIAERVGKPLLIHKVATGEIGARAAMSHTGSLAGSDAAYRAAFRRAGAMIIDDLEALLEATCFFAKAPAPRKPGVAVVATSGGAAIMAADKAELHGIPLPQTSPEVRAVLEQYSPYFGSSDNPCDVTAQVTNDPASLWACGEALMADDAYGAIVMPHPLAFDGQIERIEAFGELSKRYGKITCNVTIAEWLEGPGTIEAERNPYVAEFRSMNRCFATLAAWQQRHLRMQRGPRTYQRISNSEVTAPAAALLASAENAVLTEREAKNILDLYGIPVVREVLVQNADEACQAAAELGFPLAMKVESPDLPHKTEAGVIRLDLKSDDDVREAFSQVMENANRVQPPPRINGVLVQPMVASGVEMMVGARLDPQFGALIVVGLGGTLVELLSDTAVELAPVTRDEASRMLLSLKGSKLLGGFRGSEPVDVDALVEVVCRLSELVADHQERLIELDVNPVICSGTRITAVDALIVKSNP